MLILFSVLCFIGIFIVLLGNKGINGNNSRLFEKIFAVVFFFLFMARYMSTRNIQTLDGNLVIYSGFGGHQDSFSNVIGNLCNWLEITAVIMITLRPFFAFKTEVWYTKYIALIIMILCTVFYYPMLNMIQGNGEETLTAYLLAIEIGFGLAFSLFHHINDRNIHISKHSYLEVVIVAILINLFTMPSYIPNFIFGLGNPNWHIIDLTVPHRIYIYCLLIAVPLILYFSLRNANQIKIRYFLLFISLGTTIEFLGMSDWTMLIQPWAWPLHLCNLALFLICINLVFMPKRLFYFTYFINVFGAILAMLMPNYSEAAKLFAPSVTYFWCNHMIAFWMPLLCVALKLFERPKLKQFFYSMIGFFAYFVVVFVLNTVFTAYAGTVVTIFGSEYTICSTDFFFINSTFIAEKMGNWAEQLFNITVPIAINGREFVIHPIYQGIYFISYVALGFGVWFVYQLFFDIADSHYDLHIRLKGIRLDKIALQSVLHGRSIQEPMEKNTGVKLELKHFSKKYGTNKYYSVEDANLDVNGGEVFGFLGPNGAGKSTIIKSIVGIQPINEGEIYVCGYNVRSQPVFAKNLIGYVPDHYALYEKLTGREYLNYIADIYEVSQKDRNERLEKYIKIFELESSIDNKIKTYSHGMKQKITIISALVHQPKLWILDEPLTGLDPTSIYQVKEQMKEHAAKGNIVFFSSHLIDIVEKLCDRIAIIKHGRIQCITTVEEIESKGMTLEEFYMSIIEDKEPVINEPAVEVVEPVKAKSRKKKTA